MIKITEDISGTLPSDQITKHFAWKIGFSNFSGRQAGLPGRQASELHEEHSSHHEASRLKKWWLCKNHAAKTRVTMQQNQPRPSKTIQNHLKQPSKTI